MNDDDFAPNLDMVETRWSLIRRAHLGPAGSIEARNHLVLKYAGAIRSYIKALTRNDADADELSQDVIVRLIQGDFAGADPDRGRFRDFLKVSVKNMVRSSWSKQNRRDELSRKHAEESNEEPVESADIDETWMDEWRASLIELGMSRLEDYQSKNDGNVYYDAMRMRSNFPDLDSAGLAAELSRLRGREINAAAYRQHLKRARIKFAEFIVEEIADGMDHSTPDRVQQELIDVGLYEYVKDVLPAQWRRA